MRLRDTFKHLALRPDQPLLVHSAYRGLAREGIPLGEVLQDLTDYFEILLMPAMSWKLQGDFDVKSTPACTGIISETFRRQHATMRSRHPTHSCSGIGADDFLRSHDLDDTPCGANSPYAHLCRADGRILMLGIGMDCCTLIHHAEESIAPGIYLCPEPVLHQMSDDTMIACRPHRKLKRDYWQFQDRLAANGLLRSASIGQVQLLAFDALDLFNECYNVLAANREAIINERRYRWM